jgi:hypothetical protein
MPLLGSVQSTSSRRVAEIMGNCHGPHHNITRREQVPIAFGHSAVWCTRSSRFFGMSFMSLDMTGRPVATAPPHRGPVWSDPTLASQYHAYISFAGI